MSHCSFCDKPLEILFYPTFPPHNHTDIDTFTSAAVKLTKPLNHSTTHSYSPLIILTTSFIL